MSHSWYVLKGPGDPIDQGDIIESCPFLNLSSHAQLAGNEGTAVDWVLDHFDAVVLTQSCDLARDQKPYNVLVCPAPTVTAFYAQFVGTNGQRLSPKKWKEKLDSIRKKHQPGFFLLQNSSVPVFSEFRVINFTQAFSVPYAILAGLTAGSSERLGLRSPYRDAVNQRFGNYFSRIGLEDYNSGYEILAEDGQLSPNS